MWTALSPAWRACLEEAWDAYCAGCVPIGAVVTDARGAVLARGRNRINQPEPEGIFLHGHPLAHAELNALIQLSDADLARHSYVLYSTMEPCPLCLGAFYMSGVRRLHFACRDPYAGSLDLLGKTPYLSRKPIRAAGPECPQLETVLTALQSEFMLASGMNETLWGVLAVWRETLPAGVALGEAIFASGELQRMKAPRLPASQAFDRLAEMV
jgi:tRNA(adenine34) deaminase